MPIGRGFGFRGWSPPWPYVGIGRGGLPRCWAYGGQFFPQLYQIPTKEEEIRILKEQAKALQEQLEMIEKRIRDLDKKEY